MPESAEERVLCLFRQEIFCVLAEAFVGLRASDMKCVATSICVSEK